MPEWLQIAAWIASPACAAGGAYAAVRVTLRWHEREIARAHVRLDSHDQEFKALQWARVVK